MMDRFRISIGSGSCKGGTRKNSADRALCDAIQTELNRLKLLSFEQLTCLPDKEFSSTKIENKHILMTQYKNPLPDGDWLFVVQAFLSTLRFPTYFSLNGVGKMCAEGLVARPDGKFTEASDQMLFPYR